MCSTRANDFGAHPFLAGGGEMGSLVRAMNWSQIAVGPVDAWPQSLRSTLSMLLPSKAQIVLFWGPEYVVFYNDAYRPVFGAKHPQALGLPGRLAWSEIWDTGRNLHALLDGVVRTGEAFTAKDLLFLIERNGFAEETYFDVSYDPVRGESGCVDGVYCIVTETTGRVVGERRLALLKDLAAQTASARSVRDACTLAIETLRTHPQDISFASVALDGETVASTHGERPDHVYELAIAGAGTLVVGLNPQRPFDEQYRAFLELIAGQLATAIASARAYEQERQRAESLAAIDRAKTAFFSSVSHEFRTPLTLMLGPLEDALRDTVEPTQRQRLELVQRNTLRLQKLVNALLDFSRIEAGRTEAWYEPIDLARLTAELASAFQSAVERAGMRLIVDCPPLDEPAYVDRNMWEKVVLNLISNAFKFTLAGEIEVTLRDAGASFELSVRDTGAGIAEDQLPHIWERFHRVEGVTARTYEGTGIGLALVHELVRLHGGSVRVQSTVGQGSTFAVLIPKGKAHLPADRIAAAHRAQATPLSTSIAPAEILSWLPGADQVACADAPLGSPKALAKIGKEGPRPRIVWADDNADMRQYVRGLLEARYDVEAYSDGEAALAAVRRQRPDLLITDVMMPRLDGHGLLRAIRTDPRTATLPVIMLSARAGEEAELEGLAYGADDYIIKPFSARELIARVDAQVKMARLRAESVESIRQRDAFMSGLLGSLTDGFYALSPDWRFTFANEHLINRFQLPIEKVVGESLWELLPEALTSEAHEQLSRAMRQRVPVEYEVFYQRWGRWFHEQAHPMDDGGLAVFTQDITKRKQVEAELVAHRENLQHLVNDRTEELRVSMQRLAASERLASLGNLAAGLGHDLANMILPIRMRLEPLAATLPESSDAHDDLAAINASLEHLTRLSTGLRLMALDPAREAASAPVTDLVKWWKESEGVFRNALPRGVRLECRIEGVDARRPTGSNATAVPALPGVAIAAHRLTQAIFNLVQNAGEALAGRTGGKVVCSAETVTTSTGAAAVAICVRDNGPGIATDHLPRIFEPFFTTKGRAIATGMGLGMVRGVIESAGGSVRVESEPNKGAAFTLTVPALHIPTREGTARLGAHRRTALVTLPTSRNQALVHAMLDGMGVQIIAGAAADSPDQASPSNQGSAEVWVAADVSREAIESFLRGSPGNRVLLLEAEPYPDGDHASSGDGRVRRLSETAGPKALRDALIEAVHGNSAEMEDV